MTVTEKQLENLKPLKKGYDPRRNLRGVPKTALALKQRLEKIGAELLVIEEKVKVLDPETGKPKYIEAVYELSRMDTMLRMMYSSKAPADRKEILERVAGKVPQAVDVTSGGEKISDDSERYESILRKLAGIAAATNASEISDKLG